MSLARLVFDLNRDGLVFDRAVGPRASPVVFLFDLAMDKGLNIYIVRFLGLDLILCVVVSENLITRVF